MSDREPPRAGTAPRDDADRFLLDVMLGKLTTYLRMCGYDTAYALDRGIETDDAILTLAAAENRTLLTRDEQLAAQASDALLLTERDIEDQLRELRTAGVDLSLPERPRRCSACNGCVERVDVDENRRFSSASEGHRPSGREEQSSSGNRKRPVFGDNQKSSISGDVDETAPEHVPDDVQPYRCRDCGQWFWKGSHWADVRERLAGL